MDARQRPRGIKKHYKLTEICNGQMTERVLTRQERDNLDPDDVDVQIDEPQHTISIKPEDDAESVTSGPEDMSGFGEGEWNLLSDTYFSGGDLHELEPDWSTHQKVRRLRRFFGDSKGRERFFITTAKPYGIALNLARSWRFIEALAE
jgi:hypothetical protein